MAITTRQAVQNYMLIDIDPTLHDQVDEWISGVGKEIDMMTDRQIIADDTATTRYYNGSGKTKQVIDDFITITKVELRANQDDVTPSDITSDVYLFPANKTPKWLLESYITFSKGIQNVLVTGRHGYCASDAIPTDLKFAATVFVSGIINYSNTSKGEIKSESIGRYSVTYETDEQKQDFERAKAIIKSYRRIR